MEKSVQLLERTRAGLPRVPSVRYHLGMAYVSVGRREDARKELQEALALSHSFTGVDEAARTLRALNESPSSKP